MAITETHTNPETEPAAGAPESAAAGFPQTSGIAAVVSSGDHKTVGRLFIGFSLLFGLLSLALLAVFNVSSLKGSTLLSADKPFQAFTLGQLSVVLLFLMPLFLGLAIAVVPLQIGARTIAFPRAAAASFWAWLLSSILLVISYIPGVGGGMAIDPTTASDPLVGKQMSELTFLALIGVALALLLAAVCVVTTIVTLRTPGMHLDQIPLFSWSMLVAGGIWLLTVPVFIGNLALILVDIKYGAPAFFGVTYNQWSQLAWFVTQPQAFAFAIPLLGIAGDAVATFSRGRQPQRGALLFATGFLGALSLGAYAQPKFFPGVWLQWIFAAQCAAIVLPVLIMTAGLLLGLKNGEPKLKSPALLGLVSLLLLLLASITAIPFGIGRIGLQYTPKAVESSLTLRAAASGSPVYTWGVLGLVVGAAVTGAAAGIFLWAPKLAGRRLTDGIGSLLVLVLGAGTLLFGVPMCVLGFASKNQGLEDAADTLFGATALGAAVLLLGVLVVMIMHLATRVSVLGGGKTDEADAWGFGQTLEWAADSPPATGNFGELAHVTSPQPLFDLTDGEARDGGAA